MTNLSLSIDRIEGEQAVLIDETGKKKFIIPVSSLPAGAHEGNWVQADMDGDQIIRLDPESEAAAKKRIDDKLARLRKRSG